MKTLTVQEWKVLYRIWRIPFEDAPKEYRARIVRGCKGKAGYESREEAAVIAKGLPPIIGFHVNIYGCAICKMFHIGNSKKPSQLNDIYVGRPHKP